jgi:phage/conjugal plasmid C-4 type zinc finger TraR family protein
MTRVRDAIGRYFPRGTCVTRPEGGTVLWVELQDQIDDTVTDGVMSARARMPNGESELHCLECGEKIPEARRRAMPGVHTCIACQSALDRRPMNSGFNRRSNKDSQLK